MARGHARERTALILTVLNEAGTIDRLLESVAAQRSAPDEIVIGLEATGHYHLTLVEYLVELGYRVALLNPLQAAQFRRSAITVICRAATTGSGPSVEFFSTLLKPAPFGLSCKDILKR